jgi:hypothetical protein
MKIRTKNHLIVICLHTGPWMFGLGIRRHNWAGNFYGDPVAAWMLIGFRRRP